MNATTIPVIDFRRRRMCLLWDVPTGTWSAYDEPPGLVHGVGFIRASGPGVCLYAAAGELVLQVDGRSHPLTGQAPRIGCRRTLLSLGLRQRFRVTGADGTPLVTLAGWTPRSNDFFLWLARASRQPHWYQRTAERWTEGLSPAALREEVNPQPPLA